ncbi:acyl-CoA thioesterase, partial [Sphingomonas endophytica]
MSDAPTPAALVADLVDLLDVEEIDTDLYRGRRSTDGVGRVFGGQVIAQALQAAQRSAAAEGKVAHSLHAYFMRAGSEEHPIIYRVVRDFEGRSFATRRVIAMQRGQPILNMAASFQLLEEGFVHQDVMPDVPPPDALSSEIALRRAVADRIPERLRQQLLRPR